jgi:hypothetical protein
VLLGGIVVYTLGPAAFFSLTVATVAITSVARSWSPAWRDFGTQTIPAVE